MLYDKLRCEMKLKEKKHSKLKFYKYNFDKITSENSQNWQLLIFWIILFELLAASFEYLFFTNSHAYVNILPPSLLKEFIIGVTFALFVWACVYNFIFWNKTNFLLLILFSCTGIYFMITNDMTFSFLVHNIEPFHLFQSNMSFALIVVLFIKLIITYLLYQLYVSLKTKKVKIK